ncbi:DMT family transporter [Roseibium sp.]|uniref:DMT family transporter n=1 Tax=Roseibium sp. TaxID=1936156 RepID=UPI003A96A696
MNANFSGWGNGLVGVLIFSGSLPATRVAVADLPPLFLTSVRAVIATLLGAGLLLLLRQKRPEKHDLMSLVFVALGVVIGFPLLTAFALESISASRSIVFIGLLPLATAFFGVMRAGERPKPLFWVFALLGSAAVAGFAISLGGAGTLYGDSLMIAAVIVCGWGYAEGAVLARTLGGWQVISWALVISVPVMAPVAFLTLPSSLAGVSAPAWAGLAYVSLFSMMIGFVFWYRGLAVGGIATVGQLQLLQPFFGLLLAAALLDESVSPMMAATTLAVVACVTLARSYAR